MLSQWWNHFLECSASNEMRSAYAEPATKFVLCKLSIFWMMFLKWVVISPYDEQDARKLVTRWLSMQGNWLLVDWAWAEIGYSFTEHASKLITCWLSMGGNWLLVGWAYVEIGHSLAEHTRKFFFIGILNHVFSPVPFSRALSNVLCLLSSVCSLSPILCSMSHFLVARQQNLVPHMLSHRENVQTSKL